MSLLTHLRVHSDSFGTQMQARIRARCHEQVMDIEKNINRMLLRDYALPSAKKTTKQMLELGDDAKVNSYQIL